MEAESRMGFPEAGGGTRMGSCYSTGIRFQLRRQISSGHQLYHIVPIVNNTVLYMQNVIKTADLMLCVPVTIFKSVYL